VSIKYEAEKNTIGSDLKTFVTGAIQMVARIVYSPSRYLSGLVDPLSASRKEGEEEIEVFYPLFCVQKRGSSSEASTG